MRAGQSATIIAVIVVDTISGRCRRRPPTPPWSRPAVAGGELVALPAAARDLARAALSPHTRLTLQRPPEGRAQVDGKVAKIDHPLFSLVATSLLR